MSRRCSSCICAGEFGELLLADAGGYILEGEQSISASPSEMVALLEAVLRRPGLSAAEREYTLTALMKLSARLSGVGDKVKVTTGGGRNRRIAVKNFNPRPTRSSWSTCSMLSYSV